MLRTAQQHANTHARHTGQTNKLKETASYSVSRLACLLVRLLLATSWEGGGKSTLEKQFSHYLSLSVLLICSDLTSFSACSYSVSVYIIVIMHSVCTIYTCASYFYAYIKVLCMCRCASTLSTCTCTCMYVSCTFACIDMLSTTCGHSLAYTQYSA